MSNGIARKCFHDSVNEVLGLFTEHMIIEKDDSSVILANQRRRCIGKATLCGDHIDLIYSIGGGDDVDRCVLASIKKHFLKNIVPLKHQYFWTSFLNVRIKSM